jgi:hypothetical protein
MSISKTLIFFTLLFHLIQFVNAQDKIIKRNGDTLKVKIVQSTPDMVEFTYPNEASINSEYKNSLIKIIYASGREENCAGEKN